jgi:DNA mismatch endonuclease (patch repair protein)
LTDVVDPETRSRMMTGIKGRDTGPELAVRRYLHATGLRFRLDDKLLQGRPDVVLPKFKTVVFVHGCFWHRHQGCPYATSPATHPDFWRRKFSRNIQRDTDNERALRMAGWHVLTIWGCEVRDPLRLDELFWRIVSGHPGK